MNTMRRAMLRRLLCGAFCGTALLSVTACGAVGSPSGTAGTEAADSAALASTGDTSAEDAGGAAEADTSAMESAGGTTDPSDAFLRPTFLATDYNEQTTEVRASVPVYTIDADLGNVINADRFWLPEDGQAQLIRDGFFVQGGGGAEFFEIYESNRYMQTPNFVTVDSLMHSYHLYFAYLLKNIERDTLCDRLGRLTDRMLAASEKQQMEMMLSSQMSDFTTAMGEAMNRNIAFFAVAKTLLDPDWTPENEVLSEETRRVIREELALIDAAAGIETSPLTGDFEDYSQYKPRGYYDMDEKLSRYFRAMMWYGRRNFKQDDASLDKSALLMTLAMDEEAYGDWAAIYAVTSFFAGASDDSGICEYRPLIREAYGQEPAALTGLLVVGDEAGWRKFHDLTAALDPPAINSVPGMDDGGETDKAKENKGFRFMGQRFSLDEAVFQQLIYSAVGENGAGERRMLPDALDVPAAFGSAEAETLLRDLGAMDYQNYDKNLAKLQSSIQKAPAAVWRASLYAGWLNTLRPLLAKKGEGYPMFMQSERWAQKSLETFLGSYTELKHDTVLYSKQVIAEMGGGDEEVLDDRGYVEPEPVVFERFSSLAQSTALGLERFGLLSADAKQNLERLTKIADRLRGIAQKELQNETPTEEEFEFIRIYGGEIEHFWQEAYRDEAENDYFASPEFPAALVVDVATDPNGQVLQLANDDPEAILVVVSVEGTLRIARGSVYSFYQFAQPMNDRLTDREWRVLIGISPDENGEYHWERTGVPDKPAWTMGYRVSYED